jgi:two-component sensor histidine kinase
VAAGEAVANAIEHGHRDNPGQEIRLRAAVTADQLRLTVTDSGRWLPPGPAPAPYRGNGIMLMRAMMDHVSIDTGTAGTTVHMDVRITGAVDQTTAPPRPRECLFWGASPLLACMPIMLPGPGLSTIK